ncbi:MAG: gamma-glutamylcyclotransferase family protein [Chloroflexota bacterium]
MKSVFQYGSNCNKERLNSPYRLNGAAKPKCKAQTTEGFEIAFDVWSQKNNCAAADLVRGGQQKAWGVLYEVPDEKINGPNPTDGSKTLSQIEGRNYECQHIDVEIGGQVKSAVTFLVKRASRTSKLATSAQYVCHIIKGLRDFDVPDDYIQHVIDVAIKNVESAAQSAASEKPALERLRTPPPG